MKDKVFATHKIGDGRQSLWCKADPYEREALVEAEPEVFYVPSYVGHKGWIGVRLDSPKVAWKLVAKLGEQSHRLIAPKRLAAAVR